jgi:hypothetical protein
MVSIPNILVPVVAHVPAPILLLALLTVSLVMIFAGGTLARVVAFLAVGLVGAAVGGTLAVQYLSPAWGLTGVLLGFVLGGLLGVALLPLGVGLAVGYAGYLVALDLALGSTVALIAGVAFFVAGLMLSGKILSFVTAVLGGTILFNVLTLYGLGLIEAMLVAALLTLIGLWVQLAPGRRVTQPTTKLGGQPSDRR